MKRIYTLLLLIACFIGTVTGLQAQQKIECFVPIGPEVMYKGMKKIGVLNFEGKRQQGQILTDLVTAELLRSNRGIYQVSSGPLMSLKTTKNVDAYVDFQTNIYQVIEREQLEKVFQEQKLGMSGAIDEGTAAEVGRVLGLDAIIYGSCVGNTRNESRYEEYVDYLAGEKKKRRCNKNIAEANATLKIVSVQTGRLLGSTTAEKSYESEKCKDSEKLKSKEELLRNCYSTIASNLVDYFTPYYRYLDIKLEKITMKAYKKQYKEACEHLINGQVDLAYPIFSGIYEADSYNPSAAFNLGALYEMVAHYDQAAEYYGYAAEMDATNSKYQMAIERASRGVQRMQVFEEIGHSVPRHEFKAVSGDALATKVKTKGKSSERHEVKAEPDQDSKTIAKVPGGLEFKVSAEEGKWYRIILRGGKEGYIQKSYVN